MDELYKKIDNLITKCLEECKFELPEHYTLYTTFFKNKISSIILINLYNENDNPKKEVNNLKELGNVIYNTLKKYLNERKLNQYLILGKKPEIEVIDAYDKINNKTIYNGIYQINIYLGILNDTFKGYLELMKV